MQARTPYVADSYGGFAFALVTFIYAMPRQSLFGFYTLSRRRFCTRLPIPRLQRVFLRQAHLDCNAPDMMFAKKLRGYSCI